MVEQHQHGFDLLGIIPVIVAGKIEDASRMAVAYRQANSFPASGSCSRFVFNLFKPVVKRFIAWERHVQNHINIFAYKISGGYAYVFGRRFVGKRNRFRGVEREKWQRQGLGYEITA